MSQRQQAVSPNKRCHNGNKRCHNGTTTLPYLACCNASAWEFQSGHEEYVARSVELNNESPMAPRHPPTAPTGAAWCRLWRCPLVAGETATNVHKRRASYRMTEGSNGLLFACFNACGVSTGTIMYVHSANGLLFACFNACGVSTGTMMYVHSARSRYGRLLYISLVANSLSDRRVCNCFWICFAIPFQQ